MVRKVGQFFYKYKSFTISHGINGSQVNEVFQADIEVYWKKKFPLLFYSILVHARSVASFILIFDASPVALSSSRSTFRLKSCESVP